MTSEARNLAKIMQFSNQIDWSGGYRMNPQPNEPAAVIVLKSTTTYKENIYSVLRRTNYRGDHNLGYEYFERYYGNGHGKHKDYIILDHGKISHDFLLISPMRMSILNRDFRDYQRITDTELMPIRQESDFIKRGYKEGYDGAGLYNDKLKQMLISKTLFEPIRK